MEGRGARVIQQLAIDLEIGSLVGCTVSLALQEDSQTQLSALLRASEYTAKCAEPRGTIQTQGCDWGVSSRNGSTWQSFTS